MMWILVPKTESFTRFVLIVQFVKKSVDFQIGETITRSYPAADGKVGEVDYYLADII